MVQSEKAGARLTKKGWIVEDDEEKKKIIKNLSDDSFTVKKEIKQTIRRPAERSFPEKKNLHFAMNKLYGQLL